MRIGDYFVIADMADQLLRECPVCSHALRVKVLHCGRCGTRIEGDFDPGVSRLMQLPRDDLAFVERFVRVRGNLREMEKQLGVSYPTVRGMLDAINRRLGYGVDGEQADAQRRLAIIESLERGEIDAEEAAQRMRTGAGSATDQVAYQQQHEEESRDDE